MCDSTPGSRFDNSSESSSDRSSDEISVRPPRLLFWETTRACNLSCQHCRAVPVKVVEPDELSTEQSKKLICQAAELGVGIFVFSGGEPLMRPDLFELVALAKEKKMHVALATNGTLLDETWVDKIKTSGIARVSVSIDSHIAFEHDQFRGEEGAFEKAIEGMKLMKKVDLPFQINATVTRRNMKSLGKIVSLAENIGASALHLFFLVPVGCGLEIPESERITANEYEDLLHWFAGEIRTSSIEMRATCAPHLQRVLLQTKTRGAHKLDTSAMKGHPSSISGHHSAMKGHPMSKGCLAGSGIVFVSSKGDVKPCGYMDHVVGNMLDTPLNKLWYDNVTLQNLRTPKSLTGSCGSCSFRFKCGGCRSRALADSGDMFGDEPMCSWNDSM